MIKIIDAHGTVVVRSGERHGFVATAGVQPAAKAHAGVVVFNYTPVNPGNIISIGNTISSIASEDLIIGNPIDINIDGKLVLAKNNCYGFAINNSISGNACDYISDGKVSSNNWTTITGSRYLIPGSKYYLGIVPGTMTHIVPITGKLKKLGIAISETEFDIELGTTYNLK